MPSFPPLEDIIIQNRRFMDVHEAIRGHSRAVLKHLSTACLMNVPEVHGMFHERDIHETFRGYSRLVMKHVVSVGHFNGVHCPSSMTVLCER